jgi:malate dehydrogenase (oxaloacetate-decarboxylating)(NADP+)
MICGMEGPYRGHLSHIQNIIGNAPGVRDMSALSLLITQRGSFFIADTYVTDDPPVEELVETTEMAAEAVRRFGIEPKIALVSHSNFGGHTDPSARKMAEAARVLRERHPDLEVEGEMHADAALNEELRLRLFPESRLKGAANLLIMPTLDAAHISFNLLKEGAEGLPIGPILLGAAAPVHILTQSVTARGLVNMSAVAVVEAQDYARRLEAGGIREIAG